MPPRSIGEYQVGWVCALAKELTAARAMLDEEHDAYQGDSVGDQNTYVLGRIGKHNVAMVCLPAGIYGTNAAATVANNLMRTFTGLRFGLMVGIGAGIPNLEKENDIRLGDVVVSQPDRTHGGVVQYDLVKDLGEGRFENKGMLRPPPTMLLTALATLQSKHDLSGGSLMSELLADMIKCRPNLVKSGYGYPGPNKDHLYCSHGGKSPRGNSCKRCKAGIVQRAPRNDTNPVIHYGVIASGNVLIKNAAERDRLGEELGAKCIEMEAAGMMNEFPCIVIRGICDYADAHKNDIWQKYAATTAAAFAKELLSVINPAKEFISVVKPTEVTNAEHGTNSTRYQLGLNLFDTPDITQDLFVGREHEVEEMEKILEPQSGSRSSTRKALILGGMGGIGKTQLTVHYAKKHHSYYSAIFWLNASSKVTIDISLRSLANRILPPKTVGKLKEDKLWVYISNWLSEVENMQWLLIFDNYDDPDQYDITKYYPPAMHGSIIITTRQPTRLNGRKIKLESMKRMQDSIQVLATRSGREDASTGMSVWRKWTSVAESQTDPDAHKLAERLDGHPLALATAGAFLNQSSVSFADYLERYELKWKVIDRMDELPDYPTRTLYTTWDLSYKLIVLESPEAALLLKLFGYLDNQDIWFDLFGSTAKDEDSPTWFTKATLDKFSFESMMQILAKFCLVEVRHETGSFSLHVCVHDWAMNNLNEHLDVDLYKLALDCISSHLAGVRGHNIATQAYHRLIPHALRLGRDRFLAGLKHQPLHQEDYNKLNRISRLLRRTGQLNAAEPILRLLLDHKEATVGVDHMSTLDTVHNLGVLYEDQENLEAAKEMYQRALDGKEKVFGLEHISTLDTVNNLGNLYADQGQLEVAEQMYRRSLDGYDKVLGSEHISTLESLSNLGNLYRKQGRADEAEEMLQRALAGREKVLGLEHTSTLNTVNNLGVLYDAQGKLDLAEQMYLRSFYGKEKALGPEHRLTLDVANNLGLLYLRQGKMVEAEQILKRVYVGFEKTGMLQHPTALRAIRDLGLLYRDQGRLEEAEEMLQQAVSGMEKMLGPRHPRTLKTIDRLGRVKIKIQARQAITATQDDEQRTIELEYEPEDKEDQSELGAAHGMPGYWGQILMLAINNYSLYVFCYILTYLVDIGVKNYFST